MNFKIQNFPVVNFYTLILCLIFSCNSEVNINSINKNQLSKETSLYLKQHSQNPINWQRWSNEIFDVSVDLDKLLVISVGYSSCHWCHVMEEETFTNDSIAKIMNENFINIKVDREENPDVDQAYMTASQLMSTTLELTRAIKRLRRMNWLTRHHSLSLLIFSRAPILKQSMMS